VGRWDHFPISPVPQLLNSPGLLRLLVAGMPATKPAELIERQTLRTLLTVLGRTVVAALALGARQRDDLAHNSTLQTQQVVTRTGATNPDRLGPLGPITPVKTRATR
jgi:hypothetical protein